MILFLATRTGQEFQRLSISFLHKACSLKGTDCLYRPAVCLFANIQISGNLVKAGSSQTQRLNFAILSEQTRLSHTLSTLSSNLKTRKNVDSVSVVQVVNVMFFQQSFQ